MRLNGGPGVGSMVNRKVHLYNLVQSRPNKFYPDAIMQLILMKGCILIILIPLCAKSFGQFPVDSLKQLPTPQERYIQEDTFLLQTRLNYLLNIGAGDTTCGNAVKRAQIRARDTIDFVISFGMGSLGLRYEKELAALCRKQGLTYQLELGNCIYIEGQTDGCYKDYMDFMLREKYGRDFKIGLHHKADSLFLINAANDTIISWDCDKEPTCIGKNVDTAEGIDLPVALPLKERRDDWMSRDGKPTFTVYRSFMDIRFVIDKKGNVSNFHLSDFIPARKENEVYKERLFELAKKEIKKNYSKWHPGEINGVPLNTFYFLRVQFIHGT
jgi:hypothetical protein